MTQMKCSICQSHRHQLKARKSKLMPSIDLYLCNTCIEKKWEPRWLVILVGRQDPAKVREYLLGRRYNGEEIPAADLIK